MRVGAPLIQALAARCHALLAPPSSTEATEHLRRARDAFDRLQLAGWTARADAELRAAGERVAADAAVDSLTPQQRHIARLVATGATNREIAAQLYISPRTVDHHLRNIFTRLNVRSRVELVHLVPPTP